MMRALLFAVIAVAASGCLEPKQCGSDAQCEGGYCHPTYGFCVYDADAGAAGGGGAMGGGGGAIGGGGGAMGGGGGAIGGGGGETGGGGGAMGGGGGTGGGGATGGGGGATGGGGGATGGGGGAMGGGGGTGGGGATGGGGGATGGGGGATGGGGGGVVPSCELVCEDYQDCQPTLDGGRCIPGVVLTFVSPDAGATLGPSSTVVVFSVRARRIDGGIANINALPFSLPGWPGAPNILAADDQEHFEALTSVPITQTTYTASAGWAGGPLVTQNVVVDRIPPVVTLELARSLDGGLHPRDGLVPLAVHTNEPLNGSTLTLTLVGTDGGTAAQPMGLAISACTQRALTMGVNDLCRQVDLSSVPFAALNGTLGLQWSVQDVAGNFSADAGPAVQVTRLRWQTGPLGGTSKVLAAPALDSAGNLFLGTQDDPGTGKLVSFSPTGALRFSKSGVGSVQSVAVSASDTGAAVQDVVFVASNTNTAESRLIGFLTDGGVASAQTACNSGRPTGSAMALYAGSTVNGRTEARAIIVQNPVDMTGGNLCTWGPRDGEGSLAGGFAQTTPLDLTLLTPPNLIASGSKAYFLNAGRALESVDVSGRIPQVGGSSAAYNAGAIGTGLAYGNDTIFATWSAALSPLTSYVGSNGFNGPTAAPQTGGSWGTTARGMVVNANGVVVTSERINTTEWLMSFVANTAAPPLNLGGGVSAPASATISAVSPVIGNFSKLYVVRRDGSLLTYDVLSSSGAHQRSPEWTGALFSSTTDVLAHPTLDCNRQSNFRNGTLYVVATDGRIAAVIVDSTKLEASAPWPKWQRGAGNTGNPASGLNPGCP